MNKNNQKLNFNPGNIFSSHLPAFSTMTELSKVNINIPNYSLSISTSTPSNNTSQYKPNQSNLVHTGFNNNTYSKKTLNDRPISIFEFEESAATRLKRKQELKKQQLKEAQANAHLKKKEEVVAKVSHARKTTIEITQNHIPCGEYNKQSLEKLRLDNQENISSRVEDYQGTLHTYSSEYAHSLVNVLNPKPLIIDNSTNPARRFYSNISTQEDPNFMSNENYNIYCSDKILAVLLTMNLNSRAWHINIKKSGNKLYFDIEKNSGLYYSYISETDSTADEVDPSSINSYDNLTKESYMINEYIKELVTGEKINDPAVEKYANFPFSDSQNYNNLESIPNKNAVSKENSPCERSIYQYKSWDLDGIKILVRCQVHFGEVIAQDDEDEESVIIKSNIYALNEYNVSNLFYYNYCISSLITEKYFQIK